MFFFFFLLQICEQHFHAEDIVWTTPTVDENGKVITVKLKCPRVKENAIPTLFPNFPKYLSTAIVRRVTRLQTTKKEGHIN